MYEVSSDFRQKNIAITKKMDTVQLMNIKSVDISYHIITFPVPQITGKRNTVANDMFSSVFLPVNTGLKILFCSLSQPRLKNYNDRYLEMIPSFIL